jgi:hypothetical protein
MSIHSLKVQFGVSGLHDVSISKVFRTSKMGLVWVGWRDLVEQENLDTNPVWSFWMIFRIPEFDIYLPPMRAQPAPPTFQ